MRSKAQYTYQAAVVAAFVCVSLSSGEEALAAVATVIGAAVAAAAGVGLG